MIFYVPNIHPPMETLALLIWRSVDWSSAEHQEMSRTPHYWREHVASWSLSALPVCQEGSKWGTQISTRAWPGQPRLEPPRPQVEGSRWPALSPLWTQMCYCSLKIILQLTLCKNVCGKLRKCLPSTSGNVQHHVLALQNEVDGVHLHIWIWACYYRAWKYQEFVINLLCYIPGVDGEKQEMVFLLGSVHLTLPQSRLPWWGLQFSETWLTQICTVEWPPQENAVSAQPFVGNVRLLIIHPCTPVQLGLGSNTLHILLQLALVNGVFPSIRNLDILPSQ